MRGAMGRLVKEVGKREKWRRRRWYLCEIFADILGCCSDVVTEWTGGPCLTCALAKEFARHV